ncbi:MAG: hypothetical protein KBA30_00835 [Clostridia bacterium]|nr:hypothetical protein [Clostridia bacterium]
MPDPSSFRLSGSVRDGMPVLCIHDAGDLSPGGFDAALTFGSGQCFRWRPAPTRESPDRFAGVAGGRRAAMSAGRGGRDIVIENAREDDFRAFWHRYLDLGTDYAPITERVRTDDYMRGAVGFACGARLLRQEFEETLLSYILSARNNIPRVMNLADALSARFGKRIAAVLPDDRDTPVHAFPSAAAIADGLCPDPGRECGFGQGHAGGACGRAFGGYRCPYVAGTAGMLAAGAYRPDLVRLASLPADEARAELKALPGVGDKVADCALLYGGVRTDVCPVDTWVARVVRDVWLGPDASLRAIMDFAAERFGPYAGYAQFWFFTYARKSRG